MNVNHIHKTVKEVFANEDVILEDYLIYLVGFEGFYILIEKGLLERCDTVDGRKAYILRDIEEIERRHSI